MLIKTNMFRVFVLLTICIGFVSSITIRFLGESDVPGFLVFDLIDTNGDFYYNNQDVEKLEIFRGRAFFLMDKLGTYSFKESVDGEVLTSFYLRPINLRFITNTFISGFDVEIGADSFEGIQKVYLVNNIREYIIVNFKIINGQESILKFKLPIDIPEEEYKILLFANDMEDKHSNHYDNMIFQIEKPYISDIEIVDVIQNKFEKSTILSMNGYFGYSDNIKFTVLDNYDCIPIEISDEYIVCKVFGGYPKITQLVATYENGKSFSSPQFQFHPSTFTIQTQSFKVTTLDTYYFYGKFDKINIQSAKFGGDSIEFVENEFNEGNDNYIHTMFSLPSELFYKNIDQGIIIVYENGAQLEVPVKLSEPTILELYPIIGKFSPYKEISTSITIKGHSFAKERDNLVGFSGSLFNGEENEYFFKECENYEYYEESIVCVIKLEMAIDYKVNAYYSNPSDPNKIILSNSIDFKVYGLSCLGRSSPNTPGPNPPVDHWFIYKFRPIKESKPLDKDSYLYFDEEYEKEVNRYQGLGNREYGYKRDDIGEGSLSPLAATFNQIKDGYSYFFYNDQSGGRNSLGKKADFKENYNIYRQTNGDGSPKTNEQGKLIIESDEIFGHTKGIVIYDHNTGEGIHITHSQPVFPSFKSESNYDINDHVEISSTWLDDSISNTHLKNQDFFCYSFGPRQDNPVSDFQDPNLSGIDLIILNVASNYGMVYKYYDPNYPHYGVQTLIKRFFDPFVYLAKEIKSGCKLDGNGDYEECNWLNEIYTKNGDKIETFTKTTLETRNKHAIYPDINGVQSTNGQLYVSSFIYLDGIDINEKMVETFNQENEEPRAYFSQSFLNTQDGTMTFRKVQRLLINKYLSNIEQSYHSNQPNSVIIAQDNRDNDHSKLLFNMLPSGNIDPNNDRYGNIFCVGDSNRHNKQFVRGGGFSCIYSPKLVSYFQSRVAKYSNIQIAEIKSNQITFYVQHKYNFPIFLHKASIIPQFEPNNIPDGLVLEFFRWYDNIVFEQWVSFEDFSSRQFYITGGPKFEMNIYRKSSPAKVNNGDDVAEWDQTWSYSLRASKEPIKANFLFAIETNQFTLYRCDILTDGNQDCNRKNAQIFSTLQLYQDSNQIIDYFPYDDKLLKKIIDFKLIYQFDIDSELISIRTFIDKLNGLDKIAEMKFNYQILQTPDNREYVDWNSGKIFVNTDPDKEMCLSFHYYCIVQSALVRSIIVKNNGEPIADGDKGTISLLSFLMAIKIEYPQEDNLDDILENRLCFSSGLDSDMLNEARKLWDIIKYSSTSGITWELLFELTTDDVDAVYQYINNDFDDEMFYEEDDNTQGTSKRSLKQLLTISVLANNDYLNQLFVNSGYFTSNQINDLSIKDKDRLLNAITKWFELNIYSTGPDNQMVELLLNLPITNNDSQKLLTYLNLAYDETLSTPINLCKGDNNRPKLCDPISLISITDLLETTINSGHQLLDENFSGGPLGITFRKLITPPVTLNDTEVNGIIIFTYDDKICDISLVNFDKDNQTQVDNMIISIFSSNSKCLSLIGPIAFDLINNNTYNSILGGYPISFTVYNCPDDVPVFISDNTQCMPSYFIESNKIECIVPQGGGQNLPISIDIGFNNYVLPHLTFSYSQPLITSMNPVLLNAGSLNQITINGGNFGIVVQNVEIYIDGKNNSPLLYNINEVSNVMIILTLVGGTGSHFISVYIKGQEVDIENRNASLTQFSYIGPSIDYFYPIQYDPTINNRLTIFGLGFGIDINNAKVYIGYDECKVIIASSSSLFCEIPPSQNSIISVTIGNQETIYSTEVFRYLPLSVSKVTSLLPTASGGLIQLQGKGFGHSTDYLNQTIFNNELLTQCTPRDTIMECSIPKGINPGTFEIISYDSYNTTEIKVYQSPSLWYYYPDTQYTFIYGTNLIPSDVEKGNSSIYMIDNNNNLTECPIIAHIDSMISCDPFASLNWNAYYVRLFAIIGGITSNEISYNFIPPYTGEPF